MMHTVRRRTYRNPPLLEAIVEFQFQPPSEGWKSVFLGKIHSQVEAEFPRVESVVGTQVEFKQDAGLVAVGPTPEAARFMTGDGGVVMTAGPDVLGLSVLPAKLADGHPGWPWLCDRALKLLKTYRTVVNPRRIQRLGVRYINAIPITPGEFRLGELVTAKSGIVPTGLLAEKNPFSFRMERTIAADERGQHFEMVQLSAQPAAGGSARLMLDVDQVWIPAVATGELNNLPAIMETLHNAVHNVFTTVVLPEVLDSFDPVEMERG